MKNEEFPMRHTNHSAAKFFIPYSKFLILLKICVYFGNVL